MALEHASRLIAAPLGPVRRALLDPGSLPDWNPAFTSVGGPDTATVGTAYPIVARGLSGTWRYLRIEESRIDTAWHVPGFDERASWLLESRATGTLVTHEFDHTGPLAVLLRHAYRGVADLRLDRLAQRSVRTVRR